MVEELENMDLKLIMLKHVKDLSKRQAEEIMSLVYLNSEDYIINEEDKDIFFEVITLLKLYSFSEVLAFLKKVERPQNILWGQPIFRQAQERIDRDIYIELYQPKGTKQHGKCKFCSHDELLITTKQLRSGDEPMSAFLACPRCKNTWTER